MKKNVKGITLIALVVIIIVMLILAGIAINLTIGNNGLFSRAQNAANIWNESSRKEENEMKNFIQIYDKTIAEFEINNKMINFKIDDVNYTVASGTKWIDFIVMNEAPEDLISVSSDVHDGRFVIAWQEDMIGAALWRCKCIGLKGEYCFSDDIIYEGQNYERREDLITGYLG